MYFIKKSLALASAALLISATGAFAQAGGPDVPANAKAQGAKQNGPSSTGTKTDGVTKTDSAPTESGAAEKKSDTK